MALRELDQIASDNIELSASACIVGAGMAGLYRPTRLAPGQAAPYYCRGKRP